MRNGIIVRKTPAHVEQGILSTCAFAVVESDAFVRNSQPRDRGPEYIPMISGFLGSKTWEVKKREAGHRCAPAGAKRVLYFPDLRNIKYGDREAFRTEMALLEEETKGIEVFLYVAVDLPHPRGAGAGRPADIAGNPFPGDGGHGRRKRNTRRHRRGDIVSHAGGKLGAGRVACAYWGEAESGSVGFCAGRIRDTVGCGPCMIPTS